ncbi:phage tail protein [Dyadobacter tibetensis]|uniref:phage tail protein n=1 Tax=Dyadobacter tibetensis TaxID=1211851 RepID=UPI000471ABE2|nr:tail fiber protein [Dyadobacter tibetensis]
MDTYLGMICILPYNFVPRGWAACNGQLLSIAQNSALFSLLGTTYGGNGVETFGLPDLRGRVPLGPGSGPGLPYYKDGEKAGSPTVTLLSTNLPSHSHMLKASMNQAETANPSNALLAAATFGNNAYLDGTANTTLNPDSIGTTGGNYPVNIMQPFIALQFCISLEGVFPSRG